MNSKDSFDSYVLFHGPPFVGKTRYFQNELSATYQRVSPAELTQSSPALGLRQLINCYIVTPLLNGEKVVVDDSLQTLALRKSYTNTVLKKVSRQRCSCVVFRPQFGKEQLKWGREIRLAEAVLDEDSAAARRIFSTDIGQWYDRCEPVTEEEEVKKFEVTLSLKVYTKNPVRIPCLMVECRPSLDLTFDPGIASILQNWVQRNDCGRIIAIFESNRTANYDNEDKAIRAFLRHIKKTTDLVVYAYWVDVGQSDLNSLMTSVLGFQMRLHCLDLFNSNSVYLYESMKHRKMVELAGMRHLKLSRALTNPDLLRHGTTQFPVPKILQCMEMFPLGGKPGEDKNPESLPLLKTAVDSDDCIGVTSVGDRRKVYIAAKDTNTLVRYEEQLRLNSSNDAVATGPDAEVNNARCARNDAKNEEKKRKQPNSTFVALPSWMSSSSSKGKLQTNRRSSGELGKSPKNLSSTIYVMSEKELLNTALMILKEEGNVFKEEGKHIEKMEENSSSVNEPDKSCRNVDRNLKRKTETQGVPKKEKSKFARKSILDDILDDLDEPASVKAGHDPREAKDPITDAKNPRANSSSDDYTKTAAEFSRTSRDTSSVADSRKTISLMKNIKAIQINRNSTENDKTMNIHRAEKCDGNINSGETSGTDSVKSKTSKRIDSDISDFIDRIIM